LEADQDETEAIHGRVDYACAAAGQPGVTTRRSRTAVNFKYHCQASRGSSPRKPAVEPEEDPQPLGNREDELPVGDGGA